jgi:hypothetical protein
LAKAVSDLPQFKIDGPQSSGIILETIKRGEEDTDKGNKTVILRMYEAVGGKARGSLDM